MMSAEPMTLEFVIGSWNNRCEIIITKMILMLVSGYAMDKSIFLRMFIHTIPRMNKQQ